VLNQDPKFGNLAADGRTTTDGRVAAPNPDAPAHGTLHNRAATDARDGNVRNPDGTVRSNIDGTVQSNAANPAYPGANPAYPGANPAYPGANPANPGANPPRQPGRQLRRCQWRVAQQGRRRSEVRSH